MSAKKACCKKNDGPKKCEVVFYCDIKPEAQNVFVVGDFNNWDLASGIMKKGKAKKSGFKLKTKLLPGEYQYKFLVDGMWFNDPEAQKQAPNPFGSLNSVVVVTEEEEE